MIFSNINASSISSSVEETKLISNKYYHVVARYISEIIKYGRRDYYKQQIVNFKNPNLLESSLDNSKNVILFGSHLGNWELVVPSLSAITSNQVVGIYKPLANNSLDKYITELRGKYGLKLAPMEQVLKQFYLPANCGYVFINDQSPAKGSSGRWIDFLGRPTYWFNGIEKINKKFECSYIYIRVVPKKSTYNVEFVPITSEDPLKAYVSLLEKDIAEYPEYWLWSHNRWKN
jgi:KDO2-lipid IV(A) lauroyltransferase